MPCHEHWHSFERNLQLGIFFAGEARKLADGERKKGRLIHLPCELSAAPYLRYLSTFVSSCQILREIQVVCNKAEAANWGYKWWMLSWYSSIIKNIIDYTEDQFSTTKIIHWKPSWKNRILYFTECSKYIGIEFTAKNLSWSFIILHKCGCKIVICFTQFHEVEFDWERAGKSKTLGSWLKFCLVQAKRCQRRNGRYTYQW